VKKAIIVDLVNQYGIDFTNGVDPEKAALQFQIDRNNHEQMRGNAQNMNRAVQQANSEVDAFAAQPGHEHLDTLRPSMVVLLQAGQATDLQDAYDKAAWMNPNVRGILQQAENLKRSQSLNKNRNAAAAVTGSPGAVNTGGAADPKNLRGLIEAAFGGGRV